MSPEYKEYSQTPKVFKEKIREAAGSNFQELLNDGFGFLVNNGEITRIVKIKELSENILKDAKKNNSPWHLVHGLANRSYPILIKRWTALPSGEARLKRGHSKGGVRGNRRSLNRGPGLSARR